MTRKSTLAAALAAVLAVVPGLAAAQVFTYSGFLKKPNGTPETSATTLNFKLWGSPTGGAAPVWAEADAVTPGSDGYFSVVLGATAPLSGVDLSAPLWLELQVAGEVAMVPRVPLTDAPRAATVPFSGIAGFPASSCPASQVVTGLGANGLITCTPRAPAAPRSQTWTTFAYGGAGWMFGSGAGSGDFTALDGAQVYFQGGWFSLSEAEMQNAAILAYAEDCSYSTAGGNPACRGARPLPFRKHVVGGGANGIVEVRYQFNTDVGFAIWVNPIVELVSGTWDPTYMQNTWLPALRLRAVVVPAQ
jgi:hypothetical protein